MLQEVRVSLIILTSSSSSGFTTVVFCIKFCLSFSIFPNSSYSPMILSTFPLILPFNWEIWSLRKAFSSIKFLIFIYCIAIFYLYIFSLTEDGFSLIITDSFPCTLVGRTTEKNSAYFTRGISSWSPSIPASPTGLIIDWDRANDFLIVD